MKNFKKLIRAALLAAAGMMLTPNAMNASQLLYFYSADGTMVNTQDSDGNMSSYLTRGMRYDGANTTYAVSNQKDVTALLDSTGDLTQKYNYTAYGIPTTYSNPSFKAADDALSIAHNPYTYSNYYTDDESSNYYLNARYYDPVIGTFLTFDTYSLPNRYMYVNGNPVMGVDPTGHWVECSLRSRKVGSEGGGEPWLTRMWLSTHWRLNLQKNHTRYRFSEPNGGFRTCLISTTR